MPIVTADESNVGYAVGLGEELISKSSFAIDGPAYDWQHTLNGTRGILSRPDYYLRMWRTDEGEYTGLLCGHVTPFFFSPELSAYEDIWYVREGSPARTKVAMALMRDLIHWALVEKGARMLQTGDIASVNTIAVDGLYKHMGFQRYGSLYKIDRSSREDAA